MFLIGLAGADQHERDAVAAMMQGVGVCRVKIYANYPTAPAKRRWVADKRLDKINALVAVTPPSIDCLVFSHVLTLQEADRVRELGGHMMHVEGSPSCDVPIRRGDLLVSTDANGHRHFLAPAEALSEVMTGSVGCGVGAI